MISDNNYVKFYDSSSLKRSITYYNGEKTIKRYLLKNNDIFICVKNYIGILFLKSVLSGIEDDNIYCTNFLDSTFFNKLSDEEMNTVKLKLRTKKIKQLKDKIVK